MSLGDGRDGDKSPDPTHPEGGAPGRGLRIKKEPYAQPTTKQSYPTRGKGRDVGRGNEGRGLDDGWQGLGNGETMEDSWVVGVESEVER